MTVLNWMRTANFGGFEWSPDERMIAYVAEPKPNTGLSFFASAADQKKEPTKVKVFWNAHACVFGVFGVECSSSGIELPSCWCSSVQGTSFEYKDDWGEQYVGTVNPRVFVLSLADRTITALPGIPSTISAANVRVHSCLLAVVAVMICICV